MDQNCEINTVHTTQLKGIYTHVAAYLRDPDPRRRKSYSPYLGSVYKLMDKEQSVTFQSECLLPRNDRGLPRVLLLFSNPHPGSIQKGMFHSPDRRIANLWRDLRNVGLFAAEDDVLKSPDSLRKHCLNVVYECSFAFGFACYWVFPTSYPSQLNSLFGPTMEPPGFADTKSRFDRLLAKWQPKAIISFNGKVFEHLTGKVIKGYTKRLRRQLIQGKYPASDRGYPVFQAYPTGWRYHKNASGLRQASLDRIAKAIHRM